MSTDEKTSPSNPTEEQTGTAQPAAPTDGGQNPEQPRPRRRGFAAMDRDRVKEIASKGGRAAHAAGTAHQFSADEARVAGKKGGLAPHVRRGGVRRRPITETAAPTSQQGSVDGR
jgi:general stress protein YciG